MQAIDTLNESDERYRALVENMGEGVGLLNDEKIFLFANQAAERIFGVGKGELKGACLNDFLPGDPVELIEDESSNSSKGKSSVFEQEIVLNDGSKKVILITTTPGSMDNNLSGTFLIFRDFTEHKQAEVVLKESEKKFRTVVEEAAEIIFTTDNSGYFTYANPRAVKLSGYSLDELKQLKYIDLIEPEYKPIVQRNFFKQYVKRIALSTTDYPFRTKSGELKWFNQNVRLNIETDEVIGFYVIARDVTELRKAEEALKESEEKYRLIVENIGEGFGFVNAEEQFVLANNSAELIFGVGPGELVGKNLEQFVSPEQYALILKETSLREKGVKSVYELDIIRPNGEKRTIHITAVPQNDKKGDFEGTYGIFRDITEQKLAEETLRLSEENLRKNNAEKDLFFSIIAHDLKSPFSSFLGLTQIMAEELHHLTMAEVQDIAVTMKNSATNLFSLLENLLEWSKIKQGTVPFNPVTIRLRAMIDEYLAVVFDMALNKGITIACYIPDNMVVYADTNMLQTIIRNLVSNAVKFTSRGGNVSVSAVSNHTGHIEIAIQDTGIGINKEMVENLFRIDRNTNRKGTEGELSTGLGLLLCKEFIEKHGGLFWVESEVGTGSKFKFTLPILN
jgi:PAS domain S-box-containing protein